MSGAFRHQALLYADDGEFIEGTLPFIREGIVNDEPILVAVSERKINRLKQRLNCDAERVRFLDMSSFGRNPARIIPVWRSFANEHSRTPAMRGIGEPVWPGRSDAELAECDRHESLLNLAFAETANPDFRLLCPYDTDGLDEDVLAAARRNHPELTGAGGCAHSSGYLGPAEAPDPFGGSLPAAPADAERITFGASGLSNVRRSIWARADAAGLDAVRQSDFVTAVNELAANSVSHGGGGGRLSVWSEPGALMCQIEDSGRFTDALVGRRRPSPDQACGRGLWLVNQLCDLVQIRSGPQGSRIRVRFELS